MIKKPRYIEIEFEEISGHPEGREYRDLTKYEVRLGTYLFPDSGEGGSHEVEITEENLKLNFREWKLGGTFLHD